MHKRRIYTATARRTHHSTHRTAGGGAGSDTLASWPATQTKNVQLAASAPGGAALRPTRRRDPTTRLEAAAACGTANHKSGRRGSDSRPRRAGGACTASGRRLWLNIGVAPRRKHDAAAGGRAPISISGGRPSNSASGPHGAGLGRMAAMSCGRTPPPGVGSGPRPVVRSMPARPAAPGGVRARSPLCRRAVVSPSIDIAESVLSRRYGADRRRSRCVLDFPIDYISLLRGPFPVRPTSHPDFQNPDVDDPAQINEPF
ncbi:hypothetical protein EVAR_13954_1 [Eumeta japonica]|uniref:Uncharacterized protein n=1 Tax=Eumeta variegata TaxID=151549 RepID=A0A4C1U8D0_EUMVA|nr:hypothetical protein EVAR_13954_1 [Eumeta japonica]